jgi:hypothetical protein
VSELWGSTVHSCTTVLGWGQLWCCLCPICPPRSCRHRTAEGITTCFLCYIFWLPIGASGCIPRAHIPHFICECPRSCSKGQTPDECSGSPTHESSSSTSTSSLVPYWYKWYWYWCWCW